MARSRELKVVIAGDADKLNRELRKSGNSLDKFGKQTRLTGTMTSRGFAGMRVAAVGASAAMGGMALVGKKVVDAASDIDESLSKNRVLFGRYAKDIDKFTKSSATSLGISRAAALEATGTFGNLFTALEIGPQASAKMSKSLVTLAADMASFNNASPEETLQAIRSGLVGETEPLRRFGVNLNDATLRTEALRMGLVKTTKEALTPQTKALAVNSLIFKQTEKAQGDFARTSGGAANQQRILNAQFADAQAKLGGLLLPTFTKGIKTVNKFVGEMQDGTGAGGRFAATLKDIWGDAKPIVTWVGRATANVAKFTAEHPNVGKLAAAVVGVGVAVKTLKFVSAATGFTTLLKAGRTVMSKLVAQFAAQGAVAGTAAGSAAAGGQGLTSAASFGKVRGAGKRLGRVGGRALGLGMAAGILLAFPDIIKKIDSFENQIRDKLFGVAKGIGRKIVGAGDIHDAFKSLPAAQPIAGGGGGDTGGLSSIARRGLSQIVSKFGGVRVSSGHRTPEENRRAGGAANSDHLTGNALDLVPAGGWSAKGTALLDRVAGWARRNPAIRWIGWRGVPGHGPGDHLHLSFRPRGPQGLPAGDVVDKLRAYGGKIRGKGDVVGSGPALAARAGRSAGLSGAQLVKMVAIAGAESGFDPKINAAGPEDSRGLWQINVGPGANPDMLKLGDLYDPMVNAKAMKIILGRQGLDAWTVHRTGAYKRFIAQARAAVVGSRGGGGGATSSGGGGSSAGGSEKAGSRIINSLTSRYSPGIDRATRAAGRTGTLMEDADIAYGQLERRFGQSDEDLGTAGGRQQRLSEIGALKDAKGDQLARAKRRATHLKNAVARLNRLIKSARKKRDKARGRTRARIVGRIRDFEDRRTDLAAELKSLQNETIPDLELDIGDLDKAAGEVAATPDTPVEPPPSAAEQTSGLLSDIELQERAGLLSPADARQRRLDTIANALKGGYGALDQRQTWELMAQQIEVTGQQTQATNDLAQALKEVKGSIDRQNALAESSIGVELRQAQRAFGDMLSRELGPRVAARGHMPGDGSLARM